MEMAHMMRKTIQYVRDAALPTNGIHGAGRTLQRMRLVKNVSRSKSFSQTLSMRAARTVPEQVTLAWGPERESVPDRQRLPVQPQRTRAGYRKMIPYCPFKRSSAVVRLAAKMSSALERPVRSRGFVTGDVSAPKFPVPWPRMGNWWGSTVQYGTPFRSPAWNGEMLRYRNHRRTRRTRNANVL
ncbi:hypothetical protein EI94DRAFT_1700507 [Lactarius quietus]|nr:hypothetical protein EI94DRAFT_1700507 [Lactarius quietus]